MLVVVCLIILITIIMIIIIVTIMIMMITTIRLLLTLMLIVYGPIATAPRGSSAGSRPRTSPMYIYIYIYDMRCRDRRPTDPFFYPTTARPPDPSQ